MDLSLKPGKPKKEHGLVYGRRHKRYQCRKCRHQATLTAGTIMEATKLPLTTWFLAFYLIGQAETGISSLALMRQLGVNYRTAWLIHNKIMEAMCEREEAYLLRGKVQIDDAYLGGTQRWQGRTGIRKQDSHRRSSLIDDAGTRCM